MAERTRWRPGRVVAKSLGCGACSGALFGTLALAIIVLAGTLATGRPGALAAFLFLGPFAAFVGTVIGTACGLVASAPMLIIADADRRNPGRSSRARRDRAALAAAGGAALLPAALGAWEAVRGARGWAMAFLCVAAVAAAGGMALGPYVLYGRRARPKQARDHAPPDGAGPDGQAAAE